MNQTLEKETKWPGLSPSGLHSAPLSTRARRERRRRWERIAGIATLIMMALAAMTLLVIATRR